MPDHVPDMGCGTDRGGIESRVARSTVQHPNHWAIKDLNDTFAYAWLVRYITPLFLKSEPPGSGHFQPSRGASTHRQTRVTAVVGIPSGQWAILLMAEIHRLTVVTTSKQVNKGCSTHLDAWVQCLAQGTSYHSEGTRRSAPGLLEWIDCCTGHLIPPAGTPAQPPQYSWAYCSATLPHSSLFT